jgi:hypothetical protein
MKDYFLISKERAKKFIHQVNNGTLPGVYNWFVDEDNFLNLLFAVNNVDYVYRQLVVEGVDDDLWLMINKDNVVLGLYKFEKEEDDWVDEPLPEELKLGEL